MAALNIIDYSAKCFVITGDTKQVKDDLKKLGGKFNARLSCGPGWVFSVSQRGKVEEYLNGGVSVSVQETTAAEKYNDKEFLNEYLNEMRKAWNDSKMLDHFKNTFSSAVRLSCGGLLVFEKPSIDKNFCFGYGLQCGTEYDDANKMASHAATSEKYFLDQNLKGFDDKIKRLETMKNSWGSSCVLLLHRKCYYSQKAPLNVFNYFLSSGGLDNYEKLPESDCKGCVKYLEPFDGIGYYYDLIEATEEDRKNILAALKHERAKFEKRLNAYLKKYGLSKVRTWSYWADA